jgi:hypothetical protein
MGTLKGDYSKLNQLIIIALANPAFAERLVRDSVSALQEYRDTVTLPPEDQALVESIQGATDIHDFAAMLHSRLLARERLQRQRPPSGDSSNGDTA